LKRWTPELKAWLEKARGAVLLPVKPIAGAALTKKVSKEIERIANERSAPHVASGIRATVAQAPGHIAVHIAAIDPIGRFRKADRPLFLGNGNAQPRCVTGLDAEARRIVCRAVRVWPIVSVEVTGLGGRVLASSEWTFL